MFWLGKFPRRSSRKRSSSQRDTWGPGGQRGFEPLEQCRLFSVVTWSGDCPAAWLDADMPPCSVKTVFLRAPGANRWITTAFSRNC